MSENRYPSQKLDQYMLRFPDGMRDRIKAAAQANNRSMNAEIVARLQNSFDAEKSADEDMSKKLQELLDYVKSLK